MTYNTLVSTTELAQHLDDAGWAILDCRYSLADTEFGRRNYLQAHITGAIYAHLSEDLAGPKTPGVTGRHPLPSPEEAAKRFSAWGIDPRVQVVAYDDVGGALAAGRAWWMLRWLGHLQAAVLDGGWQKWLAEGRPRRDGVEARPRRRFVPAPNPEMLVNLGEVEALRLDPDWRVFDARAAERYHGKNETIDPVAGHIPGALSAPYFDNLNPDQTFRSPEELRQHYQALLGEKPAAQAVFYCGSGVTSTHNILAMLYAELGEARLYAGSWSEWICDPHRPVVID
jgi:thiosulfate/3-mercaptopyruvate sulfurtransferase